MARPQAENGHIDIANEIAEALCRVNLSPYESRILWALWRKTYGWHKKEDAISCSQFQTLTHLDRRHVSRTIKKLIDRHIITGRESAVRGKRVMVYAFQKDYEQWLSPAGAPLPTEALSPAEAMGVSPAGARKLSPTEADTKEKKETIQKKQSTAHNPEIKKILTEMQTFLGYPGRTKIDPIPNYGKEGMFIKRMLARGFTPKEILACWKKKVSQRGEFVSMTWVNEDIGKGGQPRVGDPDKYKNQKYGNLVIRGTEN